jgi:hypothetical protein
MFPAFRRTAAFSPAGEFLPVASFFATQQLAVNRLCDSETEDDCRCLILSSERSNTRRLLFQQSIAFSPVDWQFFRQASMITAV